MKKLVRQAIGGIQKDHLEILLASAKLSQINDDPGCLGNSPTVNTASAIGH